MPGMLGSSNSVVLYSATLVQVSKVNRTFVVGASLSDIVSNARKLSQSWYASLLHLCMARKVKVKVSRTRYRALGPKLIPVYRQSARR